MISVRSVIKHFGNIRQASIHTGLSRTVYYKWLNGKGKMSPQSESKITKAIALSIRRKK